MGRYCIVNQLVVRISWSALLSVDFTSMPELRTILLKNIVNKEVSWYNISDNTGLQWVLEYELPLVLLFNPLNTELNPICHLLALLGAHHILHVSRIRVKHCTVMERGGVEVYFHLLLTSHCLDLTVPLPPLPVVQGEEWAPVSVMMQWRR